ncbi:MAG: hypothetical protein ACK5NT_01855 [Pyrinomonadaceae bacterium]
MNKHIPGILIFSLIVSLSIVVHSFFNQPKKAVFVESQTESVDLSDQTYCFSESKTLPLHLDQAVFDVRTGSWGFSFGPERIESANGREKLVLHFYSVNSNGVEHISTEKISSYRISSLITSSFAWSDKMSPAKLNNVYVMMSYESAREKNPPPAFDPNQAIPVLIRDK